MNYSIMQCIMFCIRDTSLEIPRILCRAALDIGGYI